MEHDTTTKDKERNFLLILKSGNIEHIQNNYSDKIDGNRYTPNELGKAARALTEGVTKDIYEIIIRWSPKI